MQYLDKLSPKCFEGKQHSRHTNGCNTQVLYLKETAILTFKFKKRYKVTHKALSFWQLYLKVLQQKVLEIFAEDYWQRKIEIDPNR